MSAVMMGGPGSSSLPCGRWIGGFFGRVEFFDQLFELFAGAVAQQENFDAERAVRGDTADDALDQEDEVVDFEAEIKALADSVASGLVRLDETAFEAEVQDPAGERVPVLDTELYGAVAGITSRLAGFGASIH
jgi:hypothetical protein